MWGLIALIGINFALSIIQGVLAGRQLAKQKPLPGAVAPPTVVPGTTTPKVFGRQLVEGIALWMGQTTPVEVRQTVQTSCLTSTDVVVGYRYVTDLALALCWGNVTQLYDIYVDNDRRLSDYGATSIQTGFSGTAGINQRATYGSIAASNPGLPYQPVSGTTNTQFAFFADKIYGGPRFGGGIQGKRDFQNDGVVDPATVRLYWGRNHQTADSYLTSKIPAGAPAWPGLTYAVLQQVSMGESQVLRPWRFEVQCPPQNLLGANGGSGNAAGDCNPITVIEELLTDPLYALGAEYGELDRDQGADTWFYACSSVETDLFVSLTLSSPDVARAAVDELLRTVDAVLYEDPTTGLTGIKLIRGGYVIGNLPVVDATTADALVWEKDLRYEGVNEVVVGYTDRSRAYKHNTVRLQNLAAIHATGRVISQTVDYPYICTEAGARRLGTRDLRALSMPKGKATIQADRNRWTLTEGDVFVLNWNRNGLVLTSVVMRVQRIRKGAPGTSRIEIEALEDVFAASAPVQAAPTDVTPWAPVVPPARVPTVTFAVSRTASGVTVNPVVNDPDTRVTLVEYQTQVGGAAASGWTTITGPPYATTVTLDPRYATNVAVRVTYTASDGSSKQLSQSYNFDAKQAPLIPVLNGYVDASGVAHVTASCDPSTSTVKFASSTSGSPSDAAVRAASATSSPFTYTSAALTAGQTITVGCFAYDAAGNESPRAVDWVSAARPGAGSQRVIVYVFRRTDGSFLTTGDCVLEQYIPWGTSIQSITMVGDVAGSCTLDLQHVALGSYDAEVSMVGAGTAPSMASVKEAQQTTFTGWTTTTISAGDVLRCLASAVSGLKRLTVSVVVT